MAIVAFNRTDESTPRRGRIRPRMVVVPPDQEYSGASFWIQNFHYPNGLPRLSETVVSSIERGTRLAAARLDLIETGGLTFAWLDRYVYVSTCPPSPAWHRSGQSGALSDAIRIFPQLWTKTCAGITATLPRLLERIIAARASLADLTTLWFEARDLCDHLWEQHFLLMYTSIIPWCSLQDLHAEDGIRYQEAPAGELGGPDSPATPLRAAFLPWPLCAAGADLASPCRTPAAPAPVFTPRRLTVPASLPSATRHYRYVQAARAAGITHFPSWNEAHTQWLDLSAGVPLKMIIEYMSMLLASEGCLDTPTDIFYLWPHELEALLDTILTRRESALQASWLQLIHDRIAEEQQLNHSDRPVPPLYIGQPPARSGDPIFREIHGAGRSTALSRSVPSQGDTENSHRLFGEPVSSGVATGVIVEVRSGEDLTRLCEESIVLCDALLPEWAHQLQRVRGCISRRGGTLSHSATLCRERQIPGIVGIGSTADKLREGQLVRLSGFTGEIVILNAGSHGNAIS
jgi:phosphohistidine swiveling domain-containing protein